MTEPTYRYTQGPVKEKAPSTGAESMGFGPGYLLCPDPGKYPLAGLRATLVCLLAIAALAASSLSGCQLAPRKPEDVFTVYREHMNAGRIDQARELLTPDSKELTARIAGDFTLTEVPEKLALFNALDPVSPPLIMKQGDNYTLLQVRTLKGGVRLVRLVRKDAQSPWKIDLSEELAALRRFLRARGILDMFREQAGEYAESWKAFTDQLEKMKIPDGAGPDVAEDAKREIPRRVPRPKKGQPGK